MPFAALPVIFCTEWFANISPSQGQSGEEQASMNCRLLTEYVLLWVNCDIIMHKC